MDPGLTAFGGFGHQGLPAFPGYQRFLRSFYMFLRTWWCRFSVFDPRFSRPIKGIGSHPGECSFLYFFLVGYDNHDRTLEVVSEQSFGSCVLPVGSGESGVHWT
ncbi:hypothetical protein NPIL_491231 [Nephila pilipes]|uniref:Uncharacterized protein n=1 Tax=Nephila pilipes TaxID=299642 RepID=A0A8X6N7T1_NEPPI|nr:hypothetical protein NPIL_491231 [Nephila pilipes]